MTAPGFIRLRPAVAADAEPLAALWGQSLRILCRAAYPEAVLERAAATKTPAVVARLIAVERLFLVAEIGGIPAGLACATFDLGSFALYVAPEFAGRGVGSRLLTAVETAARASGLRSFAFHSSRNALPFYRRHGYEPTGPADENPGGMGGIPVAKIFTGPGTKR